VWPFLPVPACASMRPMPHVKPQGNIEFLVAETPDGKLDLQDSFVFDEGEVED